jgi:general secretion pathway protein D
MKRITLMAAVALLGLAQPVAAQYSMNMRDVDVRALASDVAKATGLTLVVDGRVNQKVSVTTRQSLSRSEYFEDFSFDPARQRVGRHPHRGGYRIQPWRRRQHSRPDRQPQRFAQPGRDRDLPLRNIEAPQAVERSAAGQRKAAYGAIAMPTA